MGTTSGYCRGCDRWSALAWSGEETVVPQCAACAASGTATHVAGHRWTVLVVDDLASVRTGLRIVLEIEDAFEVVGEATNGADAVAFAMERHPDLIVMDCEMPVMDGVEATARLHAALPGTRVLALSSGPEPAVAARAAGAGAFLEKVDLDLLPDALLSIAGR